MLSGFDEATRKAPIADKGFEFAAHKYNATIKRNDRGRDRLRVIPVNELAAAAGEPLTPTDFNRV